MVKCPCRFGYLFSLIVLLFASCHSRGQAGNESPAGYNLLNGKKLPLFHKLREVSGIAFLPGSDSLLMTVNDEEGRIYPINIRNSKEMQDPYVFSGKGDYEDITFFNGRWRVLQSNGLIFSGDLSNSDWPKPAAILPAGEYEGMVAYHDTLFVICKECPANKPGTATVYLLKESGDDLYLQDSLLVEAGELLKGTSGKMLASGLARHPFTGEWYILSHLNGSLLITDALFKVKQSFVLPRTLFLQPEGIAFSPRGDLYISNEGGKGQAYIMEFKYGE